VAGMYVLMKFQKPISLTRSLYGTKAAPIYTQCILIYNGEYILDHLVVTEHQTVLVYPFYE
jgi:hypothetical protein